MLSYLKTLKLFASFKVRSWLQVHPYLSYEDRTGKCLLRQAPLSNKHLILEMDPEFRKTLTFAVSRCSQQRATTQRPCQHFLKARFERRRLGYRVIPLPRQLHDPPRS
jgi:hypothetical protein